VGGGAVSRAPSTGGGRGSASDRAAPLVHHDPAADGLDRRPLGDQREFCYFGRDHVDVVRAAGAGDPPRCAGRGGSEGRADFCRLICRRLLRLYAVIPKAWRTIMTRDFVGYGPEPPHAQWPGDARIAVNFVINFEEGSELSYPNGDGVSEGGLTEMLGVDL